MGAKKDKYGDDVHVKFGKVEVRTFTMILGDNPGVSKGLPLTIDWKPWPGVDVEWIDEYESRRGKRRPARKLRLSKDRRLNYLTSLGYQPKDFVSVLLEITDIQQSRMENSGEKNWDKFNNFFDTKGRAVLGATSTVVTSSGRALASISTSTGKTMLKAVTVPVDTSARLVKGTSKKIIGGTNKIIGATAGATQAVVGATMKGTWKAMKRLSLNLDPSKTAEVMKQHKLEVDSSDEDEDEHEDDDNDIDLKYDDDESTLSIKSDSASSESTGGRRLVRRMSGTLAVRDLDDKHAVRGLIPEEEETRPISHDEQRLRMSNNRMTPVRRMSLSSSDLSKEIKEFNESNVTGSATAATAF